MIKHKSLRLFSTGHRRDQAGAALVLSVTTALGMLLVGIAVSALLLVIGGRGELSNATDSGVLNLTKRAPIEIGVRLRRGEEEALFAELNDRTDKITLRTYNRAVTKALIIGINAKSEGTASALANARRTLALLQSGENSIAGRLAHDLKASGNARPLYEQTTLLNSVRMLNSQDKSTFKPLTYRTAYLEAGGAANVVLPAPLAQRVPADARIVEAGGQNRTYPIGYKTINLGDGLNYSFVPLRPNQLPNLVSQKLFDNHTEAPVPTLTVPNAFSCTSDSPVGFSGSNGRSLAVATRSCGVVGSNQQQYPGEFTRGFIKIVNKPGFNGPLQVANVTAIFNAELATGIFLGASSESMTTSVFTTDSEALDKLIAHNLHPDQFPMPAVRDGNGNPVFFDNKGNPLTAAGLTRVTSTGAPGMCNDYSIAGANISPTCRQLLGAFTHAYPARVQVITQSPHALMAVEQFGRFIREHWFAAMISGSPHSQSTFIYAPNTSTGLRLFNRTGGRSMDKAAFSDKFSNPGNTLELLNFVGYGAPSFINQIYTRLQLVKPEVTLDELNELLSSADPDSKLELGSTHYIYMRPDRRLVLSAIPPQPDAQSLQADGRKQSCSTPWYRTLGITTNPPNVNHAQDRFWNLEPSPSVEGMGRDEASFTGSSGYKNLLGVLEFSNSARGGGYFADAN